ncbi:MAG: hypothetical protein AVDCRST_MAG02-3124, partial [uncultured Rubrobacteraceae bacterium]
WAWRTSTDAAPCAARTTVTWTSARSSGSIAPRTRRGGFSCSAPS